MQLLDHGFVRFVEDWGYGDAKIAEAGIIEAARQSTQGTFRGWERDEALLRYLYEHKHDSPFEFAGMILEIRAPIMVFREWHRHRTQSYNEMSARFTELPMLYYTPAIERLMNGKQASKNKQGSVEGFTREEAFKLQGDIIYSCEQSRLSYKRLLAAGLARELARGVLPVFWYSQMRVCANLRNWLAFLTLRMHPEAQWEIRMYANAVAELIAEQFPRTYALFEEGQQQ